jgi:hypothetical protein
MYRRALDRYRKVPRSWHKWALVLINDLAKLYRKQDKNEEVEALEQSPEKVLSD